MQPLCCNYSKTLTLTVNNTTKSNKRKWRKCAKSDYVIEAGIIWARNRCLSSDVRVVCQGWTVHCGARDPQFVWGDPIFGPLPFRGDSLETKNPWLELGLKKILFDLLKEFTKRTKRMNLFKTGSSQFLGGVFHNDW